MHRQAELVVTASVINKTEVDVYIGITRAKKQVILVSHRRAQAQAIRMNVIAKRNAQLGRKIIASINKIKSRAD